MRYVGRYRHEAIQCRGDNIRSTYRRIVRQPWIASPHFIDYVSQVRWRLRNDGLGRASPAVAPRPAGEGGFETRPYGLVQPRPKPTSLIFDIC
ncbi:MAG: hypothetical protein LBM98_05180 [Oscillospiraceae bacterium]|nr:hypothetical protein [Oscillospiraceae bacterium]